MKFVQVFLFALLGIHLTVAAPQPFLSSLSQTFGDLTQRAVDGATKLADTGIALGTDLANRGIDTANGLANNGLNLADNLSRNGLDAANRAFGRIPGVTGGLNLANGLTRGALDAAQRGVDVATGLANNGLALGNDLARRGLESARDVAQGVTGAIVDGSRSIAEIKGSIFDSIRGSLNGATSSIVRSATNTFQNLVNQVQDQAERLLAAGEDKLAEIRRNVEVQKDRALVVVNDVINQLQDQIGGASAEAREELQRIVDAFIDRTSRAVDECSAAVQAPAQQLQNTIRGAIRDSLPVVDNVLEQIRRCANLNQRNLRGVSQCAQEITAKAKDLQPLVGQYANLLAQVARTGVSTIQNSPCVVNIGKQLVADKNAILRRANEILGKATRV